MTEKEKLLYSLLVIKEVLNESDIDEEIEIKSNGNKFTFNFYEQIKKCVVDYANNLKPLKFEELKEGMWIWDNYWEEYFEISEVYSNTKEIDVLIHQNKINRKRYETIKYTPNRFYRKEVQE